MVLCMYVLQTKKSLVIGLVSKLNADGGCDTNIIIYVKLWFLCIYVSLFVRNECERLVKNQASKKNQCSLQLACEKSNLWKAICEAHD